jgi:hypothetical protein
MHIFRSGLFDKHTRRKGPPRPFDQGSGLYLAVELEARREL